MHKNQITRTEGGASCLHKQGANGALWILF